MPGDSLSGSYTSLEDVYRGTTLPNAISTGANVRMSVMKALALGGAAKKKLEPLLNNCTPDIVKIIMKNSDQLPSISQEEISDTDKMPTTVTEEAALLGAVPMDNMDDIELKNIQLQFPSSRRLSNDATCSEARVRTDRGDIVVAVHGDRSKPAIITYHDLGLNYVSSFQAFFSFVDMRSILQNFCVYHVNAPGQEEGAPTLPMDYVYPTMDELANQINYVLGHFGIKSFVGFGVGAGANILARYALAHPQKVGALTLINCNSTQSGWIEWYCQKYNSRNLRAYGMTEGVLGYLMWHHFGKSPDERNRDLVNVYRQYFQHNVNTTNLAMFTGAYIRRTDLGISRTGATLRVPVLNITGAQSPHVDDTVTFNGRLDPANSTWMKISDCGMVLEEQPAKISEAFRLFLQGEGYAVLSLQKITVLSRKSSKCSNSD